MPRFTADTGRIGPSKVNMQTFAPSQPAAAFGAGVGQALQGLGVDIAHYAELKRQQDNFDAATKFQVWRGSQERALAEAVQNAPAGAPNFTNEQSQALDAAGKDFLASIPPEVQARFAPHVEAFKQNLVSNAFNYEMKARRTHQISTLDVTLNQLQDDATANPASAQAKAEEWASLVSQSSLTDQEKIDKIREGQQAILESEYIGQAQHYADYQGATSTEIAHRESAPQVAMLNAIGGPESGNRYNVRYDGTATGTTFTDFSDHPRVFVKRPDGRYSSAAGRYQFTASTWDWVSKKLGLTDFSPASQDKAAWWLAQHVYEQKTGKNLEDTILSGDRTQIAEARQALAGTWESFANMSNDQFANEILGSQGVRGVVEGARHSTPDIWNDPHYAEIPFSRKFALARVAQRMINQDLAAKRAGDKQQHYSMLNDLLIDLRDGKRNYNDLLAAEGTWLTDFNEQQRARNVLAERDGKQTDLRKGLVRLQDGHTVWSQANADDRKQLNAIMDYSEADRMIAEKNTDWVSKTLIPITQQTHMIAPLVYQKLKGLTQSRDLADVSYAMNVEAQLEDQANPAWQQVASEEDIRKLQWWRRVAPYYMNEPSVLLQRLNRLTDTRYEPERKALLEKGKAFLNDPKKMDDSKILNQFGGWFSSPGLPGGAQLNQEFRDTFDQLFLEEYQWSGDANTALETAGKVMMKKWGVTTIGGHTKVMKYAPETIYPAFGTRGGDKSWIEPQARQELAAVDPRFKDSSFKFMLVPDGKTEQEYGAYEHAAQHGVGDGPHETHPQLPSYLVMTFDPQYGYPQPLRDGQGNLVRWHGAITEDMRTNLENQVVQDTTKMRAAQVQDRIMLLKRELTIAPEGQKGQMQAEIDRLNKEAKGLQQSIEHFTPPVQPSKMPTVPFSSM